MNNYGGGPKSAVLGQSMNIKADAVEAF